MNDDQAIPSGVWPVMLTPFKPDCGIDWSGLDALTDWYLEQGVAGLFAICLSSEMFNLDAAERTAIAARVIRRVAGKVPVVACGGFGESRTARAEDVLRMAGTGVAAVVLPTCLLASEDADEATWQRVYDELLVDTGSVPLGLYECPVPYKRLLTDAQLAAAAASKRFVFMKDTCCDAAMLARRLQLLAGSRLRLFNANLTTLLKSLSLGAAGYCSCAANLVPAHFVELCRCSVLDGEREKARRLHLQLTLLNATFMLAYPCGAKFFLALNGLPIGETCRVDAPPLTHDQREIFRLLDTALRSACWFIDPMENNSHRSPPCKQE